MMSVKGIGDLHKDGPNVPVRFSLRKNIIDELEKLKIDSRFSWNEFFKDVIEEMNKKKK